MDKRVEAGTGVLGGKYPDAVMQDAGTFCGSRKCVLADTRRYHLCWYAGQRLKSVPKTPQARGEGGGSVSGRVSLSVDEFSSFARPLAAFGNQAAHMAEYITDKLQNAVQGVLPTAGADKGNFWTGAGGQGDV